MTIDPGLVQQAGVFSFSLPIIFAEWPANIWPLRFQSSRTFLYAAVWFSWPDIFGTFCRNSGQGKWLFFKDSWVGSLEKGRQNAKIEG